MNFICFKIYIFFILFDTFISSNTYIPRTNNNKNNNPKNVTTDITPLGPVPDIITLDYISEHLKQIQLIKDEVIKEKLKKLRLLKKKSKDNKNDKDLKNEIEHLEKELIDTRLLCKDYIKNELEEINILKDQIVNDKIDQYRWTGDKLIDYELKKLFFQARLKKDKKLYEQYMKKLYQNYVIEEDNFKMDKIILKILQRINNFFTEFIKNISQLELSFGKDFMSDNYIDIINNIPQLELSFGKVFMSDNYIDIINNIPQLELSFGKYLDDKLRKIHNKFFKRKSKSKSKSKRKSRTFFELWSAFHDWLEEKAIKYHIGAYTLFFTLVSTIANILDSIITVSTAALSHIGFIILGSIIIIICIIILIIFFYYVYKLISDHIKSKRE
ncbi:Plasmodium exported protein, unknown function [Plasmodium gaboni]|uniref:PIR protein n=1 Tax=Plasmodium gaboni TaxID=647221 RepID=A0ABY0KW19_9APIC|nr:Plasmodium exported protein, unknown function [Plasmodium gaboni]